jgi:hypothetical protein
MKHVISDNMWDMAYTRVLEIFGVHAVIMFSKIYVLICVYMAHSNVYPKGNARCLKKKYYVRTLCLGSKGMQKTVVCFDGYGISHFGENCQQRHQEQAD